jgi:integrase
MSAAKSSQPQRGRWNAARWTVALALGLRQSEALGFQWRDIDLDIGKLSVRRGLHRWTARNPCSRSRRHREAGEADQDRLLALITAADHQRLYVINALLRAGTPIDAEDETLGRQALRLAAERGRDQAVAHLLARGADPHHRIRSSGAPPCSGVGAVRSRSSSRPATAAVGQMLTAALSD